MKLLCSEIIKFYKNNNALLISEILFLSLMVASLPSIEAPKNIFLVFFVITATIRQLKTPSLHVWGSWDYLFISFIGCALLSTIFPGYPSGEAWGGFRVLLTYTSVGWLISRSNYSNKQITWLFWLTILSALPPLSWGFLELFYFHSKNDLQLHSVGHVNHSAIYLTIIFGAATGAALSKWKNSKAIFKICMSILVPILYFGLIISQSRGALGVGFLLAATIIIISECDLKIKKIGFSLLLLSSLLTFLIGAQVIQKQKYNEAHNDVLAGRAQLWNVIFETSRSHPLLGIGMNNWKLIKLEDLKKSVEKRGENFIPENYYLGAKHAHSLYLGALLERGFIGLMSVISLMTFWLITLIRTFKDNRKNFQFEYLWMGSLSAWFATFLIGTVNSTFHHEHAILACILLSLQISYKKNN